MEIKDSTTGRTYTIGLDNVSWESCMLGTTGVLRVTLKDTGTMQVDNTSGVQKFTAIKNGTVVYTGEDINDAKDSLRN